MFLKNLQKILVAIDNWTDDREREHVALSAHDLYIQLYASYANTQTAFLSGRVLRKHRRFRPALPADGIGTNLLNTYFRMYSQEVSGVRVRLHLNEHTVETVSDNEGYIFAAMPLNGGLPAGTHTITASVLHTPFKVNNITLATANCFLPPPDAAFGVISDIDDTTIVSKTYSPWRMLYTILCVNAHRRTAVQGVPQWYNTLHENGKNPFFYVSSSPWNIYDILTQVFDLQHVPQGAILLRDYGIDPDKFFLGTHSEHKQKAIDQILATYPHLNFILSGDTAQHDTEIYCAAARTHGSRIKAIYIRDVGVPARRAYAEPILQAAQAEGINCAFL